MKPSERSNPLSGASKSGTNKKPLDGMPKSGTAKKTPATSRLHVAKYGTEQKPPATY